MINYLKNPFFRNIFLIIISALAIFVGIGTELIFLSLIGIIVLIYASISLTVNSYKRYKYAWHIFAIVLIVIGLILIIAFMGGFGFIGFLPLLVGLGIISFKSKGLWPIFISLVIAIFLSAIVVVFLFIFLFPGNTTHGDLAGLGIVLIGAYISSWIFTISLLIGSIISLVKYRGKIGLVFIVIFSILLISQAVGAVLFIIWKMI